MLLFNFTPFPILTTERLILRRPVSNDLPEFFKMRTDEQVMKYVGRPRPHSPEELKPLFEKMETGINENTDIAWVIALKSTGEFLGSIGFWRNDPENFRGEIGYMLQSEYFGKGYATEALHAALNYGFSEMKLNTVLAITDPENTFSQKILLKAGFLKEGHIREDFFFEGKFYDSAMYGLLRKDYKLIATELLSLKIKPSVRIFAP